jgi:hypothetical protein
VVHEPVQINEPLQAPMIEHQDNAYDEFIEKHELKLSEDDVPLTRKMEYLVETSKKTKMTLKHIITAAMNNEQLFIDKFLAWDSKADRIVIKKEFDDAS